MFGVWVRRLSVHERLRKHPRLRCLQVSLSLSTSLVVAAVVVDNVLSDMRPAQERFGGF